MRSKNTEVGRVDQPIFQVSDAIALINQTLDYAYPTVAVEGEVAGFTLNQGRYVFFDLKDSAGTLNCFMMAHQLRLPIEDGMKVIVVASAKLTPRGRFSLTVRAIKPSGEGQLKRSFALLKTKLEAEGLFRPERKRLLPEQPTRVGVITSTQAAGYADFIRIAGDRWGGVRFEVAQVKVQGDGAADQMIKALAYFNAAEHPPEVVVLIRGGGSSDDLAAYNDEPLVRAVASSRVPTLVGVGHETDTSLVDMVADVRAATPSNAAQLLVPDKREITRAVSVQVAGLMPRLERIVEELEWRAESALTTMIEVTTRRIDDTARQVAASAQMLRSYDPRAVLRRGYALVRGERRVGGRIEIELASAIIKAKVEQYDEI